MKMKYKKHQHNYLARKNSLKCTCCGNYYNAWWTKEQATNCASYFYINNDNQYAIYGSYPSGFDDIRFIVVNPIIVQARHIFAIANRENTKNKWGHYDDSPLVVCDFCIQKYLDKGYIVEDTTYDPYAVIDELNSFYAEDPVLYMQIMSHGPNECMRLIREERAKPIEQRRIEKAIRDQQNPNSFIILQSQSLWD